MQKIVFVVKKVISNDNLLKEQNYSFNLALVLTC